MSFDSEEINKRLKDFREKHFYPSWDDIAEDIGISGRTLNRWRKGKIPSNRTLAKIDYFLKNNDYDSSVKECIRCNSTKERSTEHFQRDKNRKDGLSSVCKECINIERKGTQNGYYERNKERMLKNNKKWKIDNKEKYLEWRREYYEDNREKQLEYIRDWQKRNPEKMRSIQQRRLARVNRLPHTLTEKEWEEAIDYFDNSCAYCGTHQSELDEVLNQEHVVPVINGGGYVAENIIPSCRRCNSSKHARIFEEWYPEQDYFSEDRMAKILNYISD